MYTEQFTVGAFNFQNLKGFKFRLLDICNKKNFTFGKMTEKLPFLSM
jgi:hypothetical protein